jgi:hypothetical protein
VNHILLIGIQVETESLNDYLLKQILILAQRRPVDVLSGPLVVRRLNLQELKYNPKRIGFFKGREVVLKTEVDIRDADLNVVQDLHR